MTKFNYAKLGFGEMWDSFHKQANEENWDEEKIRRISNKIREGINQEIKELAESGVLK